MLILIPLSICQAVRLLGPGMLVLFLVVLYLLRSPHIVLYSEDKDCHSSLNNL